MALLVKFVPSSCCCFGATSSLPQSFVLRGELNLIISYVYFLLWFQFA